MIHLHASDEDRLSARVQFLRLNFFSLFQVIVSLHKQEPDALAFTDFAGSLQALFRATPEQLYTSHYRSPDRRCGGNAIGDHGKNEKTFDCARAAMIGTWNDQISTPCRSASILLVESLPAGLSSLSAQIGLIRADMANPADQGS
jgi:hypothetical protein